MLTMALTAGGRPLYKCPSSPSRWEEEKTFHAITAEHVGVLQSTHVGDPSTGRRQSPRRGVTAKRPRQPADRHRACHPPQRPARHARVIAVSARASLSVHRLNAAICATIINHNFGASDAARRRPPPAARQATGTRVIGRSWPCKSSDRG